MKEKAKLEAKAAKVAKVAKEKVKLEAKAAKVAKEKVKLEAKIKEDKIGLIKKMKSKGLTNDEIFEFSNLDKEEFEEYLKIIEEEK